MTIYVVRHGKNRLDELAQEGIKASEEKGKEIRIMLKGVKNEVLILTSPKNRAIQTAENIRIGLKGEDIEIKELDSLSDKGANVPLRVLMDILKLPVYPVLVLVTHANYMYEVAQAFGYTGGKLPDEVHLEDYEVEPEEYGPIFKKYRV